jgi:hypothetical protein
VKEIGKFTTETLGKTTRDQRMQIDIQFERNILPTLYKGIVDDDPDYRQYSDVLSKLTPE